MKGTGMLASVNSLAEALQAAAAGVDIIDLKEPARGALGALAIGRIETIVRQLDGIRPVSATIGDLPMVPEDIVEAVKAMAATRVDYVKIGFFPEGDWAATVDGLAACSSAGIKLIAVLFADTGPDLVVIGALKRAGFTGVMLDTLDKGRGALTDIHQPDRLSEFVAKVAGTGMLCGLAGSLREQDIGPLLRLQPDYLGFRGALCQGGKRTDALDPEALRRIRDLIAASMRPFQS